MSNPANLSQGFPKNAAPFVTQSNGVITRPWLLLLIELWNRTGQAIGGGSVLPGSVVDWSGGPVPEGWLLADGQAISRTAYATLFATIGTTWGPGDGSTTFNIPDLRDRFILGAGPLHPVGTVGGSGTVVLSVPNLPAHNHPVVDPGHSHGVTDPGHAHGITDPGHVHGALAAASTNTTGASPDSAVAGNTASATTGITVNSAVTGISVSSALTGVTTGNTGAGAPVSILPPFAAMVKIIKF